MMKRLNRAVTASIFRSMLAPSLCMPVMLASGVMDHSLMAQGLTAARGRGTTAVAHVPVPEFISIVRSSPFRVMEGERPALLEAVNGAMLEVDQQALAELRQMDAVLLKRVVLAEDFSVDLDLHQVSIFADDALVLASRVENGKVVSQPLPLPAMTIFAGKAVDDPNSVAVISISEHGVQGFVNRMDETYILSTGSMAAPGMPIVFRLDEDAAAALGMPDFQCGADEIPQPFDPTQDPQAVAGGPDIGGGNGPPCRIARIAIETDYEFTQALFGGNTGAATAYAGTLLAGSSEVFKRDVNVRFQIVFLQLWTTVNDPWTQQGSTSDQLVQFRDYWQANNEWIDRDLAHFLSGRGLGGGVAWLSAMCEDAFDYALSANLVGTFPYPTQMQSQFNWDIIVVTHELGHNFGSPHTHSYAPQIDGCGTGNCANANQGTLMSYCHQCPGGLANMNIRFHEVVIDRILDYLDNETLCDLLDVTGPPDPNNDYFDIAAGTPTRIDVLRNDLSGNCSSPSIIGHDALSQAGGTVSVSVGTGPNGRNELLYTPPNGFTGADQFLYTVASGGSSALGQVKLTVIPLRIAENPACVQPGIAVGYYELSNPTAMPNFSALQPYDGQAVAQINFLSSGGNFAGSGRTDQVGAVFVGYLEVPESNAYAISVLSDDGSLVYLGNELIINNDGLHGMVEKVAVRGLAAGRHKLRVEFFENGGDAGLILTVSGAGIFKQPVPASMLQRDSDLLADLVTSATLLPPADGVVDGADLAFLIGAWGPANGSIADIVNSASLLPPADGIVDGADLAYLIGGWGNCN